MGKHLLNNGKNARVLHAGHRHHVQHERNHVRRDDEVKVAFLLCFDQGYQIHHNEDTVQQKKNQYVLQGYCAPFCPAMVAVFRIVTLVVTSYFTVGNVLFQSERKPFHTFG